MTPLYNHNSRETAYLVSDYPYGRLRCKIWFWLEHSRTKGYRFCSQTENPKNGRMNAHKMSTYSKIAGCMYLDEQNHVHWSGVTEYTDCDKALDFVQKFPDTDLTELKIWSNMNARYCKMILDKGESFGKLLNELDIERYQAENKTWAQVNLACQAREAEKNI